MVKEILSKLNIILDEPSQFVRLFKQFRMESTAGPNISSMRPLIRLFKVKLKKKSADKNPAHHYNTQSRRNKLG